MTGILDPLAQASVEWLDEIVIGFERKWGIDRLAKLVDPALAVRFRAQADKLNEALSSARPDAVKAQAAAMVRAWCALDAAATAASATPFSPLVWETTLPSSGEIVAIVRDEDETLAIAKDRRGAVWTLAEVAIAIEAFGEQVRATKAAFPGALVKAVRPRSLNIDATPRPHQVGPSKQTTRTPRLAGGRWPSVAGATSRAPPFNTPSTKSPVDWERGDEIPF